MKTSSHRGHHVLSMRPRETTVRIMLLAACLGLVTCASMKPPTLRVQGLGVSKVGITGANLKVNFGVTNPNPEDLLIERFEYELVLNGRSLGRGYVSEPVSIKGFGEERVTSDFNLDFLKVPGTVKAVLQQDRARAQARGHFYVRQGSDLKKIGFDSDAEVNLGR